MKRCLACVMIALLVFVAPAFPAGAAGFELPEGTQSGTTFRLKGKGIPALNGRGRGDQYVTVYIETPRNLNKEQKEALKKFAESMGDSNYEARPKFFKKFKK